MYLQNAVDVWGSRKGLNTSVKGRCRLKHYPNMQQLDEGGDDEVLFMCFYIIINYYIWTFAALQGVCLSFMWKVYN